MEFLPKPPVDQPKNLYPCLAQITISPAAAEPRNQRRQSQGSVNSNTEEDTNALRRVISGGPKRRTSFGVAADMGNHPHVEKKHNVGTEDAGKWWWRVQAGVTGTHLVLLPLTQPPNSLLTQSPAPLSHAMPAHSITSQHARTAVPGSDHPVPQSKEDDTGLVSKVKQFLHISSSHPTTASTTTSNTTASNTTTINQGTNDETISNTTSATAIEGERVLDQTATGEPKPSAAANAIGATNISANAETGWPGVIDGQKLASVVIDLQGVDKSKVLLGGGKKEGGFSVDVPITSYFAGMIHGMIDPIGKTHHHDIPKSGSIRFEFDKEWIGAKGEAELLHFHITQALTSLPAPAPPGQRQVPQSTNFQLGSNQHQHHHAAGTQTAGAAIGGNAEQGVMGETGNTTGLKLGPVV